MISSTFEKVLSRHVLSEELRRYYRQALKDEAKTPKAPDNRLISLQIKYDNLKRDYEKLEAKTANQNALQSLKKLYDQHGEKWLITRVERMIKKKLLVNKAPESNVR